MPDTNTMEAVVVEDVALICCSCNWKNRIIVVSTVQYPPFKKEFLITSHKIKCKQIAKLLLINIHFLLILEIKGEQKYEI
jgi:hypothetical protein